MLGYLKLDKWKCNCERGKIVSTALVGLEPWISGKLIERLGNKDDTARPQGQGLLLS